MDQPQGTTRTAPIAERGSTSLTRGVRVQTHPVYMSEQSDPEGRQFVFGYRIVISNQSDERIQVVARHWVIIDAHGNRRDVEGEGVVGQQPSLEPGESFEYASFCPLPTRWGTMEGSYLARAESGDFRVRVERFYFVSEEE
ncbi:MAG TPA: Co2+/Mg2+ efflux protein ApaG [Phycisphaerales bacterium]|nr:Co2+/Mg2+ efflux protein ApaG [Phycisphaerales bacterium]